MKPTRETSEPNDDTEGGSIGISPPMNLEVHRFALGTDEYLALSFPVAIPLQRGDAADCLTPSERAISALLLAGRSNAEIGRIRGTSPRTIANQVAAIYRKLGVGSRRELHAGSSALPEHT